MHQSFRLIISLIHFKITTKNLNMQYIMIGVYPTN